MFNISNICYFRIFKGEVYNDKVGKHSTSSAVHSRESFWSAVGKNVTSVLGHHGNSMCYPSGLVVNASLGAN